MLRGLDLYCKAGGCSAGYARAGFEMTGVDIEPQPRYPYRFIQGDALEYVAAHGHEYDFIHASPPCQAHTSLQGRWGREYPDLIAATRAALRETGKPYVIENVVGAPLENPLMLCGSMFGLKIIRHRLFETDPPLWFPPSTCSHPRGAVGRQGHRGTDREWITVTGHFSDVPMAQQVMELPWMTQAELAQAIPPAYTAWIAEQIHAAGVVSTEPAWVPCDGCEDFACTIHGMHAYDCACPPVEEWETDPYTPGAQRLGR